MFKKFKKATFKVSWIKDSERSYEGKGMYCQHSLSEDSANYLACMLAKSGENSDIRIEKDVD